MDTPDFYSQYKAFPFEGWVGQRENCRCHAIVMSQAHIYKDARVLDLAGFWGHHSFAALKHGARSVVIVEARSGNINNGKGMYEANDIPKNKYEYIQGDVHDVITTFKPGEFDVVLVCGFLYHTAHHFKLIEDIAKYVAPRFQVYDTAFHDPNPNTPTTMKLLFEDAEKPINAWAESADIQEKLVAWPTRNSLKLMLECTGYEFFYEFPKAIWKQWFPKSSGDYTFGWRSTLFFRRQND
jgi:hypothetical protein